MSMADIKHAVDVAPGGGDHPTTHVAPTVSGGGGSAGDGSVAALPPAAPKDLKTNGKENGPPPPPPKRRKTNGGGGGGGGDRDGDDDADPPPHRDGEPDALPQYASGFIVKSSVLPKFMLDGDAHKNWEIRKQALLPGMFVFQVVLCCSCVPE